MPPARPPRVTTRSCRTHGQDHLHPHRRGAAAGDVLLPADHRGLRRKAGVEVETRDISLAGRIIAQFPDRLTDEQRLDDALAELGELATDARGQHHQAAQHLRLDPAAQGRDQGAAGRRATTCRTTPRTRRPTRSARSAPATTRSRAPRSTRSCARATPTAARRPSVKNYAKAHPHSMGAWSSDSKTNVATMGQDDFRSNEKSVVIEADDTLRIEHVGADGTETVLKEGLAVLAGEVVDGTFMNVAALRRFLDRADRPGQGRRRALLGAPQGHDDEGLRPDHLRPRRAGLLPDALRAVRRAAGRRRHLAQRRPRRAPRRPRQAAEGGAEIKAAVEQGLADGPAMAMVDSDKGITNLHVPSDVIIDASMPAMIRTSGHMWGPDGEEHDTLAVIPDSSYAGDLPDRHRRLPRPRRLRPRDHGLGAQRRPDGQGGRGVRLARQDLRGPRRRHRRGRQRRRRRADRARRRSPATSGAPARPRTPRSATGSSSPSPAPAPPATPAIFWLDESRAHDANLIAKIDALPPRARHRGPRRSRSWRRPRRRRTRSSGSARARTPSR